MSLQSVFLQEQSYGALRLVSVPSRTPAITHDLAINITGRAAGWTMMIDYDGNRFDRRTVEAIGVGIRDIFDTLFTQPACRLMDLPLHKPEPGRTRKIVTQRDAPAPQPRPNVRTSDGVRAIWADILGLPEAECDGDFFDLGGHSLLVLRMLSRVADQFGVRPGISDFLEAPTLSAFGTRLSAMLAPTDVSHTAEQPDPIKLIWLKEAAPDAPLILSINQPFLYFNLARHLDDGFACANLHVATPEALETDDRDALDALLDTAEALAADLGQSRPVLLIGQCVDGVLANMIADRLAQHGHPVEALAMIDSWAPRDASGDPRWLRRYRRISARLRRMANYSGLALRGRISLEEFLSKSGLGQRVLIRLGKMEPMTDAEQQEWHINDLLQAHIRRAPIQPRDGATLLFATDSQTRRGHKTQFGWTGLLPADTPIFALPGWHEDALLGHGTREIAAILQARLSRAAPPHPTFEVFDMTADQAHF